MSGRQSRRAVLTPISEKAVERGAWIIGGETGDSSFRRALAELRRRRDAGETVAFFSVPEMLVVGPPLSTNDSTAMVRR